MKKITYLFLAVVFIGANIFFADYAYADFRVCNNTASRVGTAIGYKNENGWRTEGWWNLDPRSCETILEGELTSRYYYLYAVDYDKGGEWSGPALMCSSQRSFTINGLENCLARGFDKTGFMEVDTQSQKSWTAQLTDIAETPKEVPVPRSRPAIINSDNEESDDTDQSD